MITIYHNARCSKSREGLEVLKNSGEDFEVKEYLKEPLTEEELSGLIDKLNLAPIELVRTNEKIWKENYKDKDLSDNELVRVMVDNPKIIQRPIVVKGHSAIIGRPAARIEELLG